MERKTRQIAGIIDILLGITFASLSIVFYLKSDYEYSKSLETTFFIIEMLIVPLGSLLLIGLGIKNIVKKDDKTEEE